MDLHPDPDNPHKCPFCEYSTTRVTDLWKHKYLCKPSSMISRKRIKTSLKTNKNPHETEDRKENLTNKFLCSFCGKSFNLKAGLLSHEMIHKDEKPFSCSSCPKTFKHKLALVMHERTHTGQRPYQCKVS